MQGARQPTQAALPQEVIVRRKHGGTGHLRGIFAGLCRDAYASAPLQTERRVDPAAITPPQFGRPFCPPSTAEIVENMVNAKDFAGAAQLCLTDMNDPRRALEIYTAGYLYYESSAWSEHKAWGMALAAAALATQMGRPEVAQSHYLNVSILHERVGNLKTAAEYAGYAGDMARSSELQRRVEEHHRQKELEQQRTQAAKARIDNDTQVQGAGDGSTLALPEDRMIAWGRENMRQCQELVQIYESQRYASGF